VLELVIVFLLPLSALGELYHLGSETGHGHYCQCHNFTSSHTRKLIMRHCKNVTTSQAYETGYHPERGRERRFPDEITDNAVVTEISTHSYRTFAHFFVRWILCHKSFLRFLAILVSFLTYCPYYVNILLMWQAHYLIRWKPSASRKSRSRQSDE
jgi:hypothetical protein